MVPVPSGARGAHAAPGAMSADQIAALEGSFRKTIDSSPASGGRTPLPQHQVATTKQYNDVLHGSVDDIVGGTGLCDPWPMGTFAASLRTTTSAGTIRYTTG